MVFLGSGNGPARAVRVEDVAKVAGVSPITVSRALRTPEKVAADTLARVMAAVASTDYQINAIASSLRSGQSSFVSVFIASLQNQHFAAAMQGTIDAFKHSRFHLMFGQTGDADGLSVEQLKALLPFRPAAIMFTGAVGDPESRSYLRGLGVPVIEVWGDAPDPVDMGVGSSGQQGGLLMGRHMGERGFARIAYVGHSGQPAAARLAGFRQGLAEFGRGPALILPMEGDRQIEDGVAAFDEVLARLPDCDAMFFGTDVMAAGAILRALERGISVPGQVAIAGYGGLYVTSHITPALTTVDIADYDVGRKAAEMLLRRLNGRDVQPAVLETPVTLRVRASTGTALPKPANLP